MSVPQLPSVQCVENRLLRNVFHLSWRDINHGVWENFDAAQILRISDPGRAGRRARASAGAWTEHGAALQSMGSAHPSYDDSHHGAVGAPSWRGHARAGEDRIHASIAGC